MAGSNEGFGVKISLVICIMLMIGFMVTSYLYYQDVEKNKQAAAEATKRATDNDNLAKNLNEQIGYLKKVIGHEMQDIGNSENDEDKTKVIGAMKNDIKTYGGDLAQTTYAATIIEIRRQLDNAVKERDQFTKEVEKERAAYSIVDEKHKIKVLDADKAMTAASADYEDRFSKFNADIAEKNTQITNATRQASEATLELDKQKEQYVQMEKKKNTEIKDLKHVNDVLRDNLDNIKNETFEVPDGMIRWVDNSTHLAWINLGSDDNLPKQITFSIYGKNNSGVGRQDVGIKGALEVTRVLGPHLSEAKILRVTNVGNPIIPEDVIYTPIWQKGRTEFFSFVGEIDIDGDGLSDRELLHDIIETSGAKIDNEVDDEGNLTGTGITIDTRFLVIGKTSDPSGLAPESKDAERINKIIQHRNELIDQARVKAVRKVNLTDFLNYIGHVPKQRLYLPGQADRPYPLKAGAASKSTNEFVGDRSSGGKVSDLYDKKPSKGQEYVK